MSEKSFLIQGDNLIKDAFYALPDTFDPDGDHIGGICGALYKITSLVKSGQYDTVTVSFDKASFDTCTEAVRSQIIRLSADLTAAFGDGCNISCNGETASVLEGLYGKYTGGGAGAVFNLKTTVVNDFLLVQDIFKKAGERLGGKKDEYLGCYVLTDSVSGDGTKEKDILGVSICFDDEEGYYIPVRGFVTADEIGRLLKELSKTCNISTFDIKNAYRIFEPFEIEKRDFGYDNGTSYESEVRCFDVLIGAYLLNPLKNDYLPGDIAKEYLDMNIEKLSDLFGKGALKDADEGKISTYVCKLSYICRMAAPLIRAGLKKTGMENLFYNIEMPLSYILYAMEKEGIIAKRDELKTYGDGLQVRINELEKLIYEAAGCEFNINSPKQLGEILFEKLGLPAEKKTKSGYSTAADVLEKLAPEHKIVKDILEYRGLAKLKSTYADGLAAFIEADGRIHTSFNQTITATGRISSTEPNLQNIPMRTEEGRLIRKVFVPKEGYLFSDADYSQIELRILAHMSEDPGLIDAYREGSDIHSMTASKVFHVPFEEVTPLQRRNAKAVNFGIVYGISSFGLSQDLSISVGEAKDYMEKYFETYPGVKAYQEKAIADAKAKGYSETLFGRRRPIPELKSGNFNLRQFGERVAMNAPIQGTAADIMKIAMINVFFRMKKEKLKSRLILQIHDELVIETAPFETDKIKDILEEEMTNAVTLSVPMEAECHRGSDWYEAK